MLLGGISIQAQVVGPTVLQKVEPEYVNSGVSVVDPARVTMLIDVNGSPASLSSYASLPDSVVKALSAWRFNPGTKDGKKSAFSVVVNVPVRRSADFYATRSRRPSSVGYQSWQSSELSGKKMDARQAAEIQKKLKDDSSSIDARIALLSYSAPETTPEMSEMHFNQLQWLIQKAPDHGALANPSAMLDRTGEDGRTRYEKLKTLWLDQLSAHPDDDAILANATYFLRLGDAEKTEQLLLAAMPKVSGTGAWLGELYAYSILAVTKLDPVSGLPIRLDATALDSDTARQTQAKLMASRDLRVLIPTVHTLSIGLRSLAGRGPIPERLPGACTGLLNYVKTVYPDMKESCEGQPIQAGQSVEGARLIQKATPIYPASAKSSGLQGQVHFSAIIAADGKIQDLALLSGALIFYESARSAILQWRYEPTKLNGQPIEVTTQIDVNYSLQ